MKNKLTAEQATQIETALKNLTAAAQELSNILDETEYFLSPSSPEYIADPDDFAYEITSWVEDEMNAVNDAVNKRHNVVTMQVHTA